MFPVESVRTWRSRSGPKSKQIGEFRDPPGSLLAGQIIQPGKQIEIFSRAQARVEATIGAGVVSDLKPDFRGFPGHIEAADLRAPARGKQQRRQDSQERGFSRAIGSDQSQDFALLDFKGNSAQRGHGQPRHRMQQRPPSAGGGREILFNIFDTEGEVFHQPSLYPDWSHETSLAFGPDIGGPQHWRELPANDLGAGRIALSNIKSRIRLLR